MIDPTTPDSRDDPTAWSDADSADLGFASRAAAYLTGQGLEPGAIVVALRTELGLSTLDAIALCNQNSDLPWSSASRPGQPPTVTFAAAAAVSPRRGHGPSTPSTANVQLITT